MGSVCPSAAKSFTDCDLGLHFHLVIGGLGCCAVKFMNGVIGEVDDDAPDSGTRVAGAGSISTKSAEASAD